MPPTPSRHLRLLPLALLLLLPLASDPVRAGVRQLVESRSVQTLTPREVLGILLAGEGPVIIDCRHPKKYAEGHIPGAVNVFHKDTWGRLEELRRWERERGIVYYDLKGVQSKVASAAVMAEGFRRVGVMEGHLVEWRRLGYPIAVGPGE
jgi:rhodanese-related sulfurtransferase